MPSKKSPRHGSLQYWPRKRASKFLPRVNWDAISSHTSKGLKGFIGYKAGMISLVVLDNTANSMTKGKKIVIPATILECPPMRILSLRLLKNGIVAKEILNEHLEKELKRKITLPKKKHNLSEIKIDECDYIHVLVYSETKKTNIKKTPDIIELGLSGTKEEKFNFAKENWNKEISIQNVFAKGELVDLRGLTKGKGLVGPVKRFGIPLKQHKSEKGQRRPGSLGPWHPTRVTFRVPMAGQLGMFTRIIYNNKIIDIAKAENKEFKNYGIPKNELLMLKGSVQGTPKRVLLVTAALRKTKNKEKKNFE